MSSRASSVRRIWLGREREVGELEGGLDDVVMGRGGLFLITGEPGIGKTRLAEELGLRAAAKGVAVHWGRTWEVGGAPPYWLFVQVLRSMCRGRDMGALEALAGGRGAVLAELLPELRRRSPGHGFTRAHGTVERFELYDGVNAFLQAVADEGPQLIVLDDLHAADPSSLLLLQFLVRDLRSRRLLVVGTYRDAEARLARQIGSALASVTREATLLPLRRLDRGEVADFAAQTTGASVSAIYVEALHRRTEGNPLFLRELLRFAGTATREPDGIREIVRARLALLPPGARSVLEVAATLGREFALDPLAEVASAPELEIAAPSGPDVGGLLELAADAGIVEPLEPRGRWRFTHVLLREGLYEDLPAGRRAALHRAAAAELRRRIGGPPLAELAHHLLLAVPAVGAGEAADATLRAAERAMDVLAFEDAAAMLGRTARLLDGVPSEERRLFEVLLALGLARTRAAEITLGKETCRHAAELARGLGDGELFARAVLGCAYEFTPGVRDAELIALLDEALAGLPPGDGVLRARCMAQLAAERQPEPDPRGPIDLARAAAAMARRTGDAETLLFTLSTAGLAMIPYGAPAERIAVGQEALRLAQAHGAKLAMLRAHLFLTAASWEAGDLHGAHAHWRSHDALAAEFRHDTFRWVTATLHAADALWTGRFAEAERRYLEAEALAREDASRGFSLFALPVALCRAAERYEDLSGIESRLRAAFGSLRHELGSLVGEMVLAQLYGRAGDRRRAAALLATVRAHPLFASVVEPCWLALLVEPCHLLGDAALAERLYPALLPRARQFFFLGPLGGIFEPPYNRELGLLCDVLGRLDDAVSHLADAEARMVETGLRSHLARVRFELAGVLLRRAGRGDVARAATLLGQARILADELGQTSLLPLIVARAAPTAPAAPIVDRVGTEGHVDLRREGEYWTISWAGRTQRLRDSRGLQVLEQLLSSPGREFHVLQLVASTGVASDGGDAGPVLDEEAVQSYRHRLLELREELDEAEGFADAGRADRARGEIDQLTRELARAVGLGGRSRRVGDAAERARTAVQKRLRNAILRIQDGLPELAQHLDRSIRTGTFCGYLPGSRPRARRTP